VIVLIDYKAGNLASVAKAFAYFGAEVCVTDDAETVASASKLVLPGVGHFSATQALSQTGMRDAIVQSISRGTPFLGICVGMQWLFHGSDEAPDTTGLGLMRGTCSRFPQRVKAPHVGWNRLRTLGDSRLLRGISSDRFVYYTHSFRAAVTDTTCGVTDYGGEFAAAVERDNVFGVQFHPEKSATTGLQILRNFVELPC
jgi:imidazole glycerol-phosphate synthase subunit HisH